MLKPNPYHAYQDRVLAAVLRLSQLEVELMQLAAECPGGKQLDVPGAKPMRKPAQPGLFEEAGP